MSHDNKQLTRRWFDEVWNKRRTQAIHEMISSDTIAFGLSESAEPISVAGFLPFYERFIGAFPDLRIAVEDVIGDGDQTACRIRATGTHIGPQLGVAPTGKKVDFTGIIWTRWRDGKIVQAWNEFDAWGLMQQIGAPRPATMKV